MNAPELWMHTQPAAVETQPANLDDAADLRRTLRTPIDYQAELDAIDRDARAAERVIYVMAALVLAAMAAVHFWPELGRWLP